jgi:hypothetical protein
MVFLSQAARGSAGCGGLTFAVFWSFGVTGRDEVVVVEEYWEATVYPARD